MESFVSGAEKQVWTGKETQCLLFSCCCYSLAQQAKDATLPFCLKMTMDTITEAKLKDWGRQVIPVNICASEAKF